MSKLETWRTKVRAHKKNRFPSLKSGLNNHITEYHTVNDLVETLPGRSYALTRIEPPSGKEYTALTRVGISEVVKGIRARNECALNVSR